MGGAQAQSVCSTSGSDARSCKHDQSTSEHIFIVSFASTNQNQILRFKRRKTSGPSPVPPPGKEPRSRFPQQNDRCASLAQRAWMFSTQNKTKQRTRKLKVGKEDLSVSEQHTLLPEAADYCRKTPAFTASRPHKYSIPPP